MSSNYYIGFIFSSQQPFRATRQQTITPDIEIIHPSGVVSPSVSYQWKIDGANVSTLQTLTYAFPLVGDIEVSLSVTYSDVPNSYNRTISYSRTVKVVLENRNPKLFYLSYEKALQSQQRRIVNLSMLQRSMPSWSTARSTIDSNYVKLFSPLHEAISSPSVIIDKMNISTLGEYEFGYTHRKKWANEFISPVILKVDGKIYQRAGEYPLGCIEDFPIRELKLTSVSPIEKFSISIDIENRIVDKTFMIACNLFCLPEFSNENSFIDITGENEEFKVVVERVLFSTSEVVRTKNRFKRIIQIASLIPCQVSNFLSCEGRSTSFRTAKFSERRMDVNGIETVPVFNYEDSALTGTISVYDSKIANNFSSEGYAIGVDKTKVFVSSLFDTITLEGDILKAGKFMQDAGRNPHNVNGSYNNNQYVICNKEVRSKYGGDEAEFSIDVEKLYNELQASRIKISFTTDAYPQKVMWFDKDANLVSEDYSVRLIECNSKITFHVNERLPIVMKIYVDNNTTPFCAGSTYQVINEETILTGVEDMFYFCNELIVKKDSRTYRAEAIRYAFETGGGIISINAEAEADEVIAYYE